MKVTDCYWEQKNLNKKVVEINIEPNDAFDREIINQSSKGYEYICVKVPVGKTDFNFGLSDMGYTMIECQYRISKSFKDFDFNDKFVKILLPNINVEEIKTEDEFEMILSNMSEGMFSTDRIVLDPHFNMSDGLLRYQNWMKTEFNNKSSQFLVTYFKGMPIGFGMYRKDKFGYDALLGGIFESYQGIGLGLLTCCQAFIYGLQKQEQFVRMITSISSNNVPVVEIYNYFDYKIKETRYVYIKHTLK